MKGRIILDTRLPSALELEATAATSADWLTIQKDGESVLRRIRPLAAVPDMPASKITSGTFDAARLPELSASKITSGIFEVDQLPQLMGYVQATEAPGTPLDLTDSIATFVTATINNLQPSDIVLVFADVDLSSVRASGTGGFGSTAYLYRGIFSLYGERNVCYGGSAASGFEAVAGSRSFFLPATGFTGSLTFTLRCRRIGAATGGKFNHGQITLVSFRR